MLCASQIGSDRISSFEMKVDRKVIRKKRALYLLSQICRRQSERFVYEPSRQVGMRGCAGRRSGRCTPQLTAAQHMQAEKGGRRSGGYARHANAGSTRGAHVRGRGGAWTLRLFEEDLLNGFTGPKITRATGVSRLSPAIM